MLYRKRGIKGKYYVYWYQLGKQKSKVIGYDLKEVKEFIARLTLNLVKLETS